MRFGRQSRCTVELSAFEPVKITLMQLKCYIISFWVFELTSNSTAHPHKAWVSQNHGLEAPQITWWTQMHNRHCPGPWTCGHTKPTYFGKFGKSNLAPAKMTRQV